MGPHAADDRWTTDEELARLVAAIDEEVEGEPSPGAGLTAHQPLVRRASCEPPQGRKAARVSGLSRVHGGSLSFGDPVGGLWRPGPLAETRS